MLDVIFKGANNSHYSYCADQIPIADGDTFVFNVSGPDGYSSKVSISGKQLNQGNGTASLTISGLVTRGTYTVSEDTSWAWRYDTVDSNGAVDPDLAVQTVVLDPSGSTVTFVNAETNSKWLDFAGWCENLFSGTGIVSGVGAGAAGN